MDKYIIVKVSDTRQNGRVSSDLGLIRSAIHTASKDLDIPVSDMVTHTRLMSKRSSDIIAKVFNGEMDYMKYLTWLRKSDM